MLLLCRQQLYTICLIPCFNQRGFRQVTHEHVMGVWYVTPKPPTVCKNIIAIYIIIRDNI